MERKCINCKLSEAVNETYDALDEAWIEPELSSVLDYFIDKLIDKGLFPVDDV